MSEQHEAADSRAMLPEDPGLPFSKFFTRGPDSVPDGGHSCGIGYVIAWQRGSLDVAGRNGAFLLEVLWACTNRLADYQAGPYRCEENQEALRYLTAAIDVLEERLERRKAEGSLGTHKPDKAPEPMKAEADHEPPTLDDLREAIGAAVVAHGRKKPEDLLSSVFGAACASDVAEKDRAAAIAALAKIDLPEGM